MTCEKCAAPLPNGASFCPSCGTPVSEHKQQNPAQHSAIAEPPLKTLSPAKIIKYIIFALLFFSFKGVRLIFCVLAFFAAPVYLIIFIVQYIRKRPKRKWGIAFLLTVAIILLTAIVNHIDNANRSSEVIQAPSASLSENEYSEEEKKKFQLVIDAHNAIYDTLKDPNSLTIYGIRMFDEETVVIRFTATNGFGGTVTNYAAYNGELLFDCQAMYTGEEIRWKDVLEYNKTLS